MLVHAWSALDPNKALEKEAIIQRAPSCLLVDCMGDAREGGSWTYS